MYWLNRFRGTKSIWAKYNAIILGVIFGLASWNPYIGLAVAVGYLAGESMGWGDWIGGLITNSGISRGDGSKNGIMWLASRFFDVGTYNYNFLALAIRGFYWWGLTLLPLYFAMDWIPVLSASLVLAICFPLSVVLSVKYIEGDTTDNWCNAESIYGGMQDVVLLLLGILCLIY